MKIAMLGAGNIGATLARRFTEAGHEVRLCNSRGPETIADLAEEVGARPTTSRDAVEGVDVVVTSVPFSRTADLADVLADAPARAVVIDTSNYYSHRDVVQPAIEGGQVESEWVSEQLGRRVIKAWNSVLAGSLATRNHPQGHPDRIALSVAGDDAAAKHLAMYLVELTGFDAVDGGPLAESWRQQPGSPAYTTDLRVDDLLAALRRADRASLPGKRDRMIAEVSQLENWGTNEDRLRIAREIFL